MRQLLQVQAVVHKSKRFFKQNSPTILTAVGVVGVIGTAVMSAKAAPKAVKLIEQAEEEKGERLTKVEKIKVGAPVYIPAIVIGAATISCVIGANVLNKRQQAAMASAYAMLDKSYKEYKSKVKELYGESTDKIVEEEIAKDKYKELDIPETDGKELFYDEYSRRYFEATKERVHDAEYQLNRDIITKDCAYLNDFYFYVDLEPIPEGYKVGWSPGACFDYYWQVWVDFFHEEITLQDGRKCTVIRFGSEPIHDLDEYI